MDTRDWIFGGEPHISQGDEMFTLPANMSSSSFWNNPTFSDFNFNVDHLQSFPQVQDPIPNLEPSKTEDTVSDVTDAQLTTSPVTTRVDAPQTSPTLLVTDPEKKLPQETEHNLKPRRHISKGPKQAFMPALFLGAGRGVLKNSNSTPQKGKADKSPQSQKRPADESSRQRHNQMMRENRGRFNKKFKELTDLLESLKGPECEDKPMKNKIQILERAMYQYALMESQRASFKNELLFSPPNPPSISKHEMDVIASAPTLQDACELVIRNMCGTLDWKYGEVWTSNGSDTPTTSYSQGFTLASAFVSPKNMPSTRHALRDLGKKGRCMPMDKYLLKLAQLKHAIWISDLSTKQTKSSRAQEAVAAGVTSMLTIPVTINSPTSGHPDAIIVLMHADDELLSYPGRVRPYDSESICRLTDLGAAVVETRSISP